MTKIFVPAQSRLMIACIQGMMAVMTDHSKRGEVSKFKKPIFAPIHELNKLKRNVPDRCERTFSLSIPNLNADIPN
jgi:hypothetical protein